MYNCAFAQRIWGAFEHRAEHGALIAVPAQSAGRGEFVRCTDKLAVLSGSRQGGADVRPSSIAAWPKPIASAYPAYLGCKSAHRWGRGAAAVALYTSADHSVQNTPPRCQPRDLLNDRPRVDAEMLVKICDGAGLAKMLYPERHRLVSDH